MSTATTIGSTSAGDRSQRAAEAPVPSQIAHVVHYTRRFKEMVEWYKSVLLMRPSYEDENVSFLTYDQEHHRIAIVNMPGFKAPEEGVAGFNHMAFTYRTLEDLLVTHERLSGIGICPYWTVNHGMTVSMYFRDPEGNRLEMQVDNFPTAQEGIDYCRTPEFAENPIGVDIDPVELLRRLRAGESEASLKVRPNIGPRGMDSFPRQ